MKEYQFEYTKMWDTLIVVLSAIAIFILTELFGIFNKLNFVMTIILSFGLAVLLFQILKRKVVHVCTAKLGDTSVIFEFENDTKTINFGDLTSYKSDYGKNGPVLYLKSNSDNFKIFANKNFCKTTDFKLFCNDTITQLDKYKAANNSNIVHEGSIFATKGMLYFLIIATLVYLLAFIIENKETRLPIGLGGGIYLLLSWTIYFNRRNLKSK